MHLQSESAKSRRIVDLAGIVKWYGSWSGSWIRIRSEKTIVVAQRQEVKASEIVTEIVMVKGNVSASHSTQTKQSRQNAIFVHATRSRRDVDARVGNNPGRPSRFRGAYGCVSLFARRLCTRPDMTYADDPSQEDGFFVEYRKLGVEYKP